MTCAKDNLLCVCFKGTPGYFRCRVKAPVKIDHKDLKIIQFTNYQIGGKLVVKPITKITQGS